jgi:hypothetical protein
MSEPQLWVVAYTKAPDDGDEWWDEDESDDEEEDAAFGPEPVSDIAEGLSWVKRLLDRVEVMEAVGDRCGNLGVWFVRDDTHYGACCQADSLDLGIHRDQLDIEADHALIRAGVWGNGVPVRPSALFSYL